MFIPARGELHLDHPAQLRVLLEDVPAARRDFRSVRVCLPGLPFAEAKAWEARLSRSMRSKGSEAAALGYGVAMVLYGLVLWLGGVPSGTNFDALSVGVALGVGGAAVGKVIGLVLANRALRRSATELARLTALTSKSAASPPLDSRATELEVADATAVDPPLGDLPRVA